MQAMQQESERARAKPSIESTRLKDRPLGCRKWLIAQECGIIKKAACGTPEREMRCSKCSYENPSLTRFCGECGEPFTVKCPKCRAENTAPFKFCRDCGIALAEEARTIAGNVSASKTEPRNIDVTADNGERRHLTVLFSDLVNSTEISARLDPEEWRDIAADYQRSAAEEVNRLGGHVAKYLGDGLVVYFGYPEAHEDDG
jgi:hypothetical protein